MTLVSLSLSVNFFFPSFFFLVVVAHLDCLKLNFDFEVEKWQNNQFVDCGHFSSSSSSSAFPVAIQISVDEDGRDDKKNHKKTAQISTNN